MVDFRLVAIAVSKISNDLSVGSIVHLYGIAKIFRVLYQVCMTTTRTQRTPGATDHWSTGPIFQEKGTFQPTPGRYNDAQAANLNSPTGCESKGGESSVFELQRL